MTNNPVRRLWLSAESIIFRLPPEVRHQGDPGWLAAPRATFALNRGDSIVGIPSGGKQSNSMIFPEHGTKPRRHFFIIDSRLKFADDDPISPNAKLSLMNLERSCISDVLLPESEQIGLRYRWPSNG